MESTCTRKNDPMVVLWTEDDENDRIMIELALTRSRREIRLIFVEDGDKAWRYLLGEKPYDDRSVFPLPDVLVTDLKMPRCNGFELTQRVRSHTLFSRLPVMVFSASDLPADRRAAERMGVDGYVAKPTGFGLWTTTVVKVVDEAASHLRVA